MYDIAAGACPPRFMCFAKEKKYAAMLIIAYYWFGFLEVKSLLQLV
jgi:hypothetical protein